MAQTRRHEMLTWEDVDRLIDHLLPQFETEFDAMVMITRGGIVPGGLLAEAMGITHLLTAAVDFPAQTQMELAKLLAWPTFIQFPEESQLRGRRALVVDDVWGSGRTITSVKNRVSAAGGLPPPACCTSTPTAACSATPIPIITPPSPMLTSSTRGRSTAGLIESC